MSGDSTHDSDPHRAPWFVVVLCLQFSVVPLYMLATMFPLLWPQASVPTRAFLIASALFFVFLAFELARHALVFAGVCRAGDPRIPVIIPRDRLIRCYGSGTVFMIGSPLLFLLSPAFGAFVALAGLFLVLWARHSTKHHRESSNES